MKPYIVYQNPQRMLLIAFGALIFVSLGFIFLFVDIDDEHPLLLKSIGAVAILFFGYCLIFALIHLLSRKPALIISEEGITDQSSAIKVGLIKWEEIAEIRFIIFLGQKFLAIYTFDKELIINRSVRTQKAINQINAKLTDAQVHIPYKNLKSTEAQLKENIDFFWTKASENS